MCGFTVLLENPQVNAQDERLKVYSGGEGWMGVRGVMDPPGHCLEIELR